MQRKKKPFTYSIELDAWFVSKDQRMLSTRTTCPSLHKTYHTLVFNIVVYLFTKYQ